MNSFLITDTADKIPIEKHGRQLVWHDEFQGNKINSEKWHMLRSMYTEGRIYDNSEKHIRVENGNLHMRICRNGDTYSLPEGLATKNTMNFKYGYLEMRARLPYRHGAWPSFWTRGNSVFHNKDLGWFAETDIAEVFSSGCRVSPNLHIWGNHGHTMLPGEENNMQRTYKFDNPDTLNSEYHTYAYEWDREAIKFYVDDTCYFKTYIDDRSVLLCDNYPTAEGFHEPQYIILNNELFTEKSEWAPAGAAVTAADEMPIDYYVDYIRLYQSRKNEYIYIKDEISQYL